VPFMEAGGEQWSGAQRTARECEATEVGRHGVGDARAAGTVAVKAAMGPGAAALGF
jgi:hypothetical protein